jgi:hypothetical protein
LQLISTKIQKGFESINVLNDLKRVSFHEAQKQSTSLNEKAGRD